MEPQTNPLVYLAGPSVFRPDAVDYALGLLSRCKAYGPKHELMDLIVRFGKVKAVGVKKPVSNRTQDWREHALFLMFKELKEMGYKLESPYGFRETRSE